jgi:hypothetical protein
MSNHHSTLKSSSAAATTDSLNGHKSAASAASAATGCAAATAAAASADAASGSQVNWRTLTECAVRHVTFVRLCCVRCGLQLLTQQRAEDVFCGSVDG